MSAEPAVSGAEEKLEDFFELLGRGASPVLLLDYDGTLAPFRVDRYKAAPWAGVRELLERIQLEGSTRMAVITGRPAGEIGPLLGLAVHPEVWGLHGAERLYSDGRRQLEEPSAAARQTLNEVRRQLSIDSLGGRFEDKPNAAVMHWRGYSRVHARQVERRTRNLFEPLAAMDGLRLLEFESGVELRTGRDKGDAVEAIVAECDPAAPVAFLGDDLTDEAGLRAVASLGRRGLGALVRREWRETAAAVWLRPPEELRAFLKRWLRAVEGQGIGIGR